MPGISFIYNSKGNLKQKESQILFSLNSGVHDEHYKQEILYNENAYFLGCTRYDKYPFVLFENDEFSIYLEGQIYGHDNSNINTELNNIAKYIFHNSNIQKNEIVKWLLNIDGDFIIFILSKCTKEICIINDALGRLPLYYHNVNGELLVSRELRFISNLISDKQFDRMAIAQCLLFGYPLGKRTLFENVLYLKPGSLIKINTITSEIFIGCVHQFNFELKEYDLINHKENLKNLVKLFIEGCKNRTNIIDENIVSLSGGLDSRAVAAGLLNGNVSFRAATFHDFNETANSDVKIAEQLAHIFNIEFKIFHLGPPKGKDILKLLKIKNGLNSLRFSFILPFFSRIKETYGNNIIYFTGDGGDKVLPDLRPLFKLKDLDALIEYIMSLNAILSLDDVATLTKIDKQEIISELRNHLATYPEKDLHSKYIHFLIYERGIKWLFEGEDRNRFYFWSVTPFYSIKFFNCAMNFPDDIKKNHRLYREFLLELSPQAAIIDNAKWKLPITSDRFKLLSFFKIDMTNIYVRFPSKVQRFFRSKFEKDFNLRAKSIAKSKFEKDVKLYENNLSIMNCMLEQIENCTYIKKHISINDIRRIIKNKGNIDNIFTITSVIEEFESEESTIKKYYEFYFT